MPFLTNGLENGENISDLPKGIRAGAIIVGGGLGTRMNNPLPKQFLLINEKPVIVHTVEKFLQAMPNAFISVVLPHNYWEHWFEFCSIHFNPEQNRRISLARGGETRTISIWNGLQTFRLLRLSSVQSNEMGLIAIHDAVRPLISIGAIQKSFAFALIYKAVISTIPINSSLRKISSDGRTSAVDRKEYLEVQTPQTFDFQDLWKAYEKRSNNDYTDDASLFEAFWLDKKCIKTIEGEISNIKITTIEDLEWARWKLSNS